MPDLATLNSTKAGAAAIDIMSTPYRLLLEGSQELFPTPTYTDTFATGPATTGGKLVRSSAENITRQGRVLCRDSSRALTLARAATFEQKIEEIRRHGGSLVYTPEGGVPITYDIEAARIVSVDHTAVMLSGGNAPITFELTFLPFGRLANETIVTNANSTTPLLSFDVPAFSGSVDGLGTLTIQDTASQARNWLEGGLESRYYVSASAWPLLVDSASMTALASASTQTVLTDEYGTSTLRQTLSTTAKGIGFYSSSWIGRFRVKARVWVSAANTAIQVRYASRGGSSSIGAWVPVTTASQWVDADLGIVSFPPPLSGAHSARVDFYAKAISGTPTFDLDMVKLIPAERYWRAAGAVGAVSTLRSGRYARLRHDALETETATGVWFQHPNSIGAYLEIPPSGGRIAVFAHRNDLTTGSYTPIADALRADLVVTPRVALLGA